MTRWAIMLLLTAACVAIQRTRQGDLNGYLPRPRALHAGRWFLHVPHPAGAGPGTCDRGGALLLSPQRQEVQRAGVESRVAPDSERPIPRGDERCQRIRRGGEQDSFVRPVAPQCRAPPR